MSLAFIPLYIKYLGIEAYGLIGLFAVLQAWLVLLDMGAVTALHFLLKVFTVVASSACNGRYRTTSPTAHWPGGGGQFSMSALRGISRFAGGMMGTTLLALLLTQVDKILISKLLTLSEYGYYMLTTVVAAIQ